MEVRKGISSVALFVIVCSCALWNSSSRAQSLSYAHAPDLPNAISPSDKRSIETYSLAILKYALSSNGIDLTPASSTVLNNTPSDAQFLINLIRDERNEDSYYWIAPLFAFECGASIRCTPNAGSQPTTIAVSYIALAKSKGSADIAERLSEIIAQYKSSDDFTLLANAIQAKLKSSFPDTILTLGTLSLVGELQANTDNLWVIADVVPLFSEVGERGKLKGIAADLVRDILDEMTLEQNILSAPWARIAKEAMSKSNVLVFSVIRTDERENVFHWVTPVSRNLHGLYGIDKPYFDSFADVPKAYRVGTLLEDYRYNVAIEHGFKVKAYDSWQALVDALINNDVDTIFGSQGAIDFGCNPNQFKCETITLTSKYDISTAYLALSKKDTCVLVLEKLKLAAAGVKMSDKFNERLSSWSDMVSQEYGIAHYTEHGVVHLWNPN